MYKSNHHIGALVGFSISDMIKKPSKLAIYFVKRMYGIIFSD